MYQLHQQLSSGNEEISHTDPLAAYQPDVAIFQRRRDGDGISDGGRVANDAVAKRLGGDDGVVDALRRHRDRQQEERIKAGELWDSSYDLVFPNTIGGIMIPDNLTGRNFKHFLEVAGLPDIRFHDLRHTAATMLLRQKVNVKVVSEMLGHADISITLRIYAHVIPDMQQEAANRMDDVFGSK